MGACCTGIGTSPSPEETAVKIRARNNFRDKYTREIEDHQQKKRNEEQGRAWQQEREEVARVRRLQAAGQQNRNRQWQERERKLQEEQRREDRRKRKEVEHYDKAQQMPDDAHRGYQAPEKQQTKQGNNQSVGLPVRTERRIESNAQRGGNIRGKRNEQPFERNPDETHGTFYDISLKEDEPTVVNNEQGSQNVKGKESGGNIHIIQPDVGKMQHKDDRQQRPKPRQRAATAPDVKGINRNKKQDDILSKGPKKPIKGIGQPDKGPEVDKVRDERRLEKRPRQPDDVEDSSVQRQQEQEQPKRKKDEDIIHTEVQRKPKESDQEISENVHQVDKVKVHPSDDVPINRERALTAQY